MPLPNQPWSTSLPGAQDTVGVEQPDLTNDSAPGANDGHRVLVEHLHALRDKLQYVTETVGDTNSLPVGSLKDKVKQDNLTAVVDPTVSDDSSSGYSIGSVWVNTVTPTGFICMDASVGAAVWQQVGGSSLPVSVLQRTTAAVSLYIDASSGNDSNNGSSGNPVQTWSRIQELVTHLDLHNLTVYATGTFSTAFKLDLGHLHGDAAISIEGQGTTVLDGPRTADIHSASTIGTVGAGWTINAYQNRFIEILSGTYSGYILPVKSNTADTITFAAPLSGDVGAVSYRITKPTTTFGNDAVFSITQHDTYTQVAISNISFDSFLEGYGGYFSFAAVSGDPASGQIYCESVRAVDFGAGAGLAYPVSAASITIHQTAWRTYIRNTLVGDLEVQDASYTVLGSSCCVTSSGYFNHVDIDVFNTSFYFQCSSSLIFRDCYLNVRGSSVIDVSSIPDGLQLFKSHIELKNTASLTGSGNVSWGVVLSDHSSILISSSTTPTLTGTSGDILFSGLVATQSWSAIMAGTPAVNYGSGCSVRKSTSTPPDPVTKTLSALTYYIDGTSGNDANDGLTATTPVQSWSKLQEILPWYKEHTTVISVKGTFSSSFRFDVGRVHPNINVTISGSETTVSDGPRVADIYSDNTIGTTGAGWTPAEHKYRKINLQSGPYAGWTIRVVDNTSDTLTFTPHLPGGPGAATYQIEQPTAFIDNASVFSCVSGGDVSEGSYGRVILSNLRFRSTLRLQGGRFELQGMMGSTSSSSLNVKSTSACVTSSTGGTACRECLIENVNNLQLTYAFFEIDMTILSCNKVTLHATSGSTVQFYAIPSLLISDLRLDTPASLPYMENCNATVGSSTTFDISNSINGGLHLVRSRLYVVGTLSGTGNGIVGVRLSDKSVVTLATGVTPTLAGASKDFTFGTGVGATDYFGSWTDIAASKPFFLVGDGCLVTKENVLPTGRSNYYATSAPTVNDDSTDGYVAGRSRWIDLANQKEYICTDASSGAAIWKETTASVSSADEKAKVTSSDTTANYLDSKIVGAAGIDKAVLSPGGAEQLQLSPAYGSSANTICQGNDPRLSDARTPTSHASSHQSGGGDSIKLDDLAAPDDNTDLDATVLAHGLLPKLGGGTTNFLRADGSWANPGGGSSPLTTKGDLYTYDTGDARLGVGTNGQVLTADSGEAAGIKWSNPASSSTYEEEFTATGGDEDFALSGTPATNVNMLSGYTILGVYRNGQRLRYQASPSSSLEYGYTSGTHEINCIGLTTSDIITVVYGV